jgi:hypothetical protein
MNIKQLSHLAVALLLAAVHAANAQGTAFTYQGRLADDGTPANGNHSLRFILYNAEFGGSQVGPTLTNEPVAVAAGLFTTTLDFGTAVLDGSPRWLEVAVRTNGSAAVHTALAPRQPLTPAPYAFRAARLTGTLPDAQLSANIARLNGTARFVGNVLFDPSSGPPFAVGNAEVVVKLNADQLDGFDAADFALAGHNHDTNYWKLTGNAGANSTNGAFLGTTDNQPLDIRVNNQRVLRIEPGTANISPNLIGGFRGNIASNAFFQSSARGAVIGGGGHSTGPNVVEDDFGVIVGGSGNTNNGNSSFIGGGIRNYVEDRNNVLVGGLRNSVDGRQCFLGGGETNTIRSIAIDSVITGGSNNLVRADFATIGGGANNLIDSSSDFGTVSGGANNHIDFLVLHGTIPGGFSNFVDGDYAFAAGRRARAVHDGAFVWADSQDTNFASTANNQVSFRCAGGVRFTSGGTAANQQVAWTPGSASWSFSSDRNLKEDIRPVDSEAVLEKLARVPISEWNYKGYPQRHIGPMAQDFHGAFPLNESTTTLNDADLHGVALAAIQGLNQKLEEQRAELKVRNAELASVQSELAELKQLVSGLVGQSRSRGTK